MLTAELIAPPSWHKLDFISDLHLQVSEPATFNAWRHYMQTTATDAVFILGDLFEVWVGDDVLQAHGFEQQCAEIIRETASRVPTFFMHGNRDFLVGSNLMAACNSTLLSDPTVLIFNDQRLVLSHGDALCLDDTSYMAFRQQVRCVDWQKIFLAKPLSERQAIARALRQQSEEKKQSSVAYADVDTDAALLLLTKSKATTLIHGHTHKPANHDLGLGLQRVVLSDWDAAATPPRVEILRLTANGLQRSNLI